MCRLERCVAAPYTDVAAFVPRDYWWMYPALVLQVAFLVLVAAIAAAGLRRRPAAPPPAPARWGRPALAAVTFTVLGAGMLVAGYGLQLFVAQPSFLAGETAGLELLSQYNPHGLFIGLENLGYAAQAVGFVFLAATLPGYGSCSRHVGGSSPAAGS
jgi:hypothetical protein